MSEVRLQVKNLCKNFGITKAVQNVSFNVNKGEVHALIGENGSGKSTLIQHLNGLLKPTDGHIYLNGQDIWADPKQIRQVRFHVGLVFQYPEYQLFEETIAKEDLTICD